MWGDVLPHYWSVLIAATYLSWPDGLLSESETAELRAAAYAILGANLASFIADGSASCTFVYPSCVNGQPAHVAARWPTTRTGPWCTRCGTASDRTTTRWSSSLTMLRSRYIEHWASCIAEKVVRSYLVP
jgi:hypothetical protein